MWAGGAFPFWKDVMASCQGGSVSVSVGLAGRLSNLWELRASVWLHSVGDAEAQTTWWLGGRPPSGLATECAEIRSLSAAAVSRREPGCASDCAEY
jgi:hypothetical protein